MAACDFFWMLSCALLWACVTFECACESTVNARVCSCWCTFGHIKNASFCSAAHGLSPFTRLILENGWRWKDGWWWKGQPGERGSVINRERGEWTKEVMHNLKKHYNLCLSRTITANGLSCIYREGQHCEIRHKGGTIRARHSHFKFVNSGQVKLWRSIYPLASVLQVKDSEVKFAIMSNIQLVRLSK